MTTYLSNGDKENYSKVSDIELNNLFQSVRAKNLNKKPYLREYKTVIKKWFAHPELVTSYELYWCYDDSPEAQVMNFHPEDEHASTLNSVVSKATVINYFYGVNAGANGKK